MPPVGTEERTSRAVICSGAWSVPSMARFGGLETGVVCETVEGREAGATGGILNAKRKGCQGLVLVG